jgi:SAM-dependent methyltransferase
MGRAREIVRDLLPPIALRGVRPLRSVAQQVVDATSRVPAYKRNALNEVAALRPLRGSKVLVVGASAGEDCKLFIDRGAFEVHGLDVIEDVGSGFQHPRVTYHQSSIERTQLPSDYFDVVLAVATMEHVPDIDAAFAEMARLACPGGIIYSLASPLWQSPRGHHMGCFDAHPWIHLVFERDDLISYARSSGIKGERGYSLEQIVDYMLNPKFFNMRPASAYLAACAQLRELNILRNDLIVEVESLLEHPLGRAPMAKGYLRQDLIARTHTLIGQKLPTRA